MSQARNADMTEEADHSSGSPRSLLSGEQPFFASRQACLDAMPLMKLDVGRGLLLAVWPVCVRHRSAKEQLIAVLRKAMFRPGQTVRQIAVHGFPCCCPSGAAELWCTSLP
jgi:hypothetical protein